MMDKFCILVVEDDPVGRQMLVENLLAEGYEVVEAGSGEAAWREIDVAPSRFDGILLDRMMPDMDGIEILHRVKNRPEMVSVPVIMQTGMTADADILEGLKAGAYYYLTKPFSADTLLAIVSAATRDYRGHRDLEAEVRRQGSMLTCLVEGRFEFHSTDQARYLAALVANAAPDPSRVVLGLSELMINAVEHGNLGIGYEQKTALIEQGILREEIGRLLVSPQYRDKKARLEVRRTADELSFLISDDGKGFAWHDYLEMSPERAFDTHGRGIAMSRLISFDRMEYRGSGNEVFAAIRLPAAG